ncbi:MAG: cold shock domain-containing protein [Okeania sp. SIO3I5]|uniref:hypothetical protein n=1 Tax=Okeania sp. SIO3I5 TaxID=2607805 RepID=UPI0013BB1DF5|nr:hypothetical protein [Okeania sp. SIO3I5]NEQ36617.1 cold shock domain-containing protein [Okeania sp. SIO3I5]
MVTGKIKWFGGFNNQRQTRNNFGFINLAEGDIDRDIYVNRREIPQDLQILLEGDNGEGVYVCFDLEENSQKFEAINVELKKYTGVVISFSGGTGEIATKYDGFFHFKSFKEFSSGDYVSCGLRHTSESEKKKAVKVKKILPDSEYNEIINICVNSNDSKIARSLFLEYVNTLPSAEAIQKIIEKLRHFDTETKRILTNKIIREYERFLVESSELRNEIINICVKNNDYKIATSLFLEYVNTLPSAEAIEKIIEKLRHFDTETKRILTNKIIQNYENFLVESPELRNNLCLYGKNEFTNYADFINKYLKDTNTNESLKQQLSNEVREKIPRDTEEKRSIYWEKFGDLVEYQGFLWNIAPIEHKRRAIQNFYKEFFQIVINFNNSDYLYAQYLQEDWKELYKKVRENKDDKQLIKEWEPAINSNEFKYAQMVSARGAERLVIKFCQALGYEVEDISIHQITKQSSDWKLADIRLNKKILLDVKNSRFTVNSKVYSEFCVPKFKQERTNQDREKKEVYIVGVLSPYLQKRFIDGEEPLNFTVEKPKVLGIFYKKSLEELKNIVNDKDRLKIDLSRLENFYSDSSTTENYNSYSPRGKISNSYLPHWLFDYGEKFYEKQIRIIQDFKNLIANLSDGEVPTWEDISIVGINPLPLFILARENLPQNWQNHLPKWKIQFINYLINISLYPQNKIISLSHLFISLLKHFLQMLEENNSEYSPQEYLDILYENSHKNHPLKIYDPLQTIHSFCNTLQTLWENREKTELSEFKMFKFRHEGILQGKKASHDSWKTIIAYCGGKIEKKGKCGYSPLILGMHESCSCGLLICPEENCQYCQKDCQSYLSRKEKNIVDLNIKNNLPMIEF